MSGHGDASAPPQPFVDDEVAQLFRPLENHPSAALAVSGGADSMALMRLASRWLSLRARLGPDRTPADLRILTVDHGLRPESPREAAFVAAAARALGLPHVTLPWDGQKPATGLQSAAREARYRLMIDHARAHGLACLVTAHHLEDQAETLLMRLARGSGATGLAGMAPARCVDGIHILRPLLGVSRERLRAELAAAGQSWIEDPSNEDDRFERARLRRALAVLAECGVGSAGLARSAARLARADAALEETALSLARAGVAFHPEGHGEMRLGLLREAPAEIALRILRNALEGLGGGARPLRLSRLETLAAWLLQSAPDGKMRRTLGGCLLLRDGDSLAMVREAGRIRLPAFTLAPGGQALWDRRFAVAWPGRALEPCEVLPLGEQAAAILKNTDATTAQRLAVAASPGFYVGGRLVAAPVAARLAPAAGLYGAQAEFLDPLRPTRPCRPEA